MNIESFGVSLRRYREAAGLTQEELAERAGLTANAIGALERGERRRPHPHTVRALAEAFALSASNRTDFLAAAQRRVAAPEDGFAAALSRPTLPAPPTPLVGRERETAAVRTLLDRDGERLITFTGPGGVGKTRLAIGVAKQAVAQFPDDVAFAPLAPVSDPALVVPTIAQGLGLREAGSQTASHLLHSFLQGKRLLLVLDNLEHLLDLAGEVAALIADCPAITILATSRAPLRGRGEREFRVEPLALPDPASTVDQPVDVTAPAVAFFVVRAEAVNSAFTLTRTNAAAVTAICRRLGGLPLALELAAAHARFLGPTNLLARLDVAIDASAARDLPGRQRTMRATIDWSHDFLTAPEQVLFRRLSVFAGGFTLEAAESVAAGGEVSRVALLGLLGALVEQSLVTVRWTDDGGARYGLLEPIRQYAQERLVVSGEEERIRDRHAAHFAALADWAGPDLAGAGQAAGLNRLGAEHDNLRATLAWLLARDQAEDAARLGWRTWWYWYIRGHLGEGRAWMERVLAQRRALDAQSRARALAVLSVLAFAQADYDGAAAAATESAELTQAAGDAPVRAFARLMQANASIGQRQEAAAMAYATESAALYRTLRDWTGLGLALAVEFHVAAAANDLTHADAVLAAAEPYLRQGGAPWGLAYLLVMRGQAAQLTGGQTQTLTWFHESIDLSWRIGDIIMLVFGLIGLAGALTECGEHVQAARLFGAVAALQERTGAMVENAASKSLDERHVAALRTQLDAATLTTAWASGRTLSLKDAIGEALQAADELREREPADASARVPSS